MGSLTLSLIVLTKKAVHCCFDFLPTFACSLFSINTLSSRALKKEPVSRKHSKCYRMSSLQLIRHHPGSNCFCGHQPCQQFDVLWRSMCFCSDLAKHPRLLISSKSQFLNCSFIAIASSLSIVPFGYMIETSHHSNKVSGTLHSGYVSWHEFSFHPLRYLLQKFFQSWKYLLVF